MSPGFNPNEKAAWWRPRTFNRQEFFRQFFIYGAMLTASGIIRISTDHSGMHKSLVGFLAWEMIYLPVAASVAAFLAWRGPIVVRHTKTRFVGSILTGIGISAAALGAGLLLR